MNFRIPCSCGQFVTVTEGAADGTAHCPCGRVLSVPSLKELRLQAGLPPYNISPEKMIEHLLLARELPGSRNCARCGVPTENLVQVTTECERTWKRRTGGFSWLPLIFSILLLPFRDWLWGSVEEEDEEECGQDKIYVLPLPVCRLCAPNVRGTTVLKECMKTIPVYDQLLEKFPEAKVRV
jgi:hypothetical protein